VRSIFLWRMVIVLFVAVLLISLGVTVGYVVLSRDAYTDIKMDEMMTKADAVKQLYLEYESNQITKESFLRISSKFMGAIRATALIADRTGTVVFLNGTVPNLTKEQAQVDFQEQIQTLLSGNKVEENHITLPNHEHVIGVGEPIFDASNHPVGALLIVKTPDEITRTMARLNDSLLGTVIVVMPIILFISVLFLRKLVTPLHDMGEVAIRMSKGDFDARADETQAGEVGLLARALNHLCDNLSQTIYQLQSEKGQLNQILSSFSEGIAATDQLGCLTLYNSSIMRMFGAVYVNNRTDLISDQAIWRVFDEVYQTGKAQTMHYPLPGERMLWITISPVVTEQNVRVGVVGLFKDMTEMERLEKTRREYVANVSHELRTPLTAVRGLLEPLCDGLVTDEEDRQRYYKIMLREIMRLSRLITDMMELSRLQSGTQHMELVEVDLNELLTDLVQNYVREAEQREIMLKLDAPILPTVLTDPDRVEQVLVILIDNAMRYTPKGGTITIKTENTDRVKVSVVDTGCGIPDEDLPHIFERFYKVDKSRKEGGTGLGLSIAKFMMEKLGESIWVESTLGQGTSFHFTLKKYVRNAIPLGPIKESWNYDVPLSDQQYHIERTDPQDASYEIILPGKKSDKRQ